MEEERLKQLNDKYEKKWEEEYAGKNMHNKPSPETLKQLEDLKISRAEDKKDIQFMKDEISEIKELVKKLDSKLDCALDKKADKATVDRIISIMFWLGGIIGAGLLTYLGSLIIQTIQHL